MTGPQVFEQAAQIRFAHCDPAGIVFYPQYFVLLNGLFEVWFDEALGCPWDPLIHQRRIGLPTVHLEADYRAVSRMGDRVRLTLQLETLGRRSFTLALQCRGSDGALRMQVRQVVVTTSLETHAAIDIPPDLREAMNGPWRRLHV